MTSNEARNQATAVAKTIVTLVSCVLLAAAGPAAETLPPKPARHFNDYAGVVTPKMADYLNRSLFGFENSTTNGVYVVIYPKLPTDSSLEDYCFRVTASWHFGHQGLDNGVVLFVFVKEHRTRIEVRPGLEGALPDAKCKDIVADVIAPKFQAGDYDGGLYQGIAAIFQAAGGEYDAEKIYAAENARLAAAWNGYDMFFLVFDVLFVVGYGLMIWDKFRRWRHRAPTTVPVPAVDK